MTPPKYCAVCGARLSQVERDLYGDTCDDHADIDMDADSSRLYDGDPEPLEFDK